MNEQNNITVVQQAYADFKQGNIGQVLDSMTDAVEWHSPGNLPTAGHRKGKQKVAEFFQLLDQHEEILQMDAKEFIAQNDKVVVLIQYKARIKSTGKIVESPAVHIFTVKDGKVTAFDEYFDTAAAEAGYQKSAAA
jgi:ketosteroid isomerase-like protein